MLVLPAFVRKMMLCMDDQVLVVNGTFCARILIVKGYKHILHGKKSVLPELMLLCSKLLDPVTPEMQCVNVGYMLIHIFDKLAQKISTDLLMAVVQKLYRSRMPSVVQSLASLFARLLLKNSKDLLALLTATSVDNRISLKILLDRWLLHQPLFRGNYTKSVTYTALLQLFTMRDTRVESLMVITYNPSHTNVNSGKP